MPKRNRKTEPDTAPKPIDETMIVLDVLERDPRLQAVLESHGLPCHRCIVAPTETLAEGCAPLRKDVAAVVRDLNAALGL